MKTESLSDDHAPPPKSKLVVVSGPDSGRELALEAGTYRIGSEPGVHLQLSDATVSRTHLVLEVLAQGLRATDPGSTNGSFVQGQRFTTVELAPPAVLRLGKTELMLVAAGEGAGALEASNRERFGKLVGKSLAMRSVFSILERVASRASDVLIEGETGTGKEVCAEALHLESPRARGPFVVCDLSAVTASLLESELFGHQKGAFTGADVSRPGVFERADGGTIFLDEIGELPLAEQPRLLRVLERREVKRVGANDYRPLDIRVVAATHRDLRQEVRAGRFREDLYHRLAVVTVRLPPLRERLEDVSVLLDAFLTRLGQSSDVLSQETRMMLSRYEWPGNVRELRNVVERAVSLGEGAALLTASTSAARPASDAPGAVPFKEAKDRLVNAFERDYIKHLLDAANGNITHAADAAGITRVYLQRLLKKHRLQGRG